MGESTRDRLVAAMSESMRERGYGSSAMKEVLAQGEVTAGSMYHFFPGGKEELAAAAVREVGHAGTELLVTTIEESSSVADGAAAFFEALASDLESSQFRYGCPVGVPAAEAAVLVDAIRDAGAEVFSSWIAAMASALEVEGWEQDSALTAARLAISAYEGASTIARTSGDASLVRDTLRGVFEVLREPKVFLN